MRGKKRLRKKLRKKNAKTIFTVSLDLGKNLSPGASLGIINQFRNECLKPAGLLFEAKPTGLGWDGKIENTNRSLLTEEHRAVIADWVFMQEEIDSYCISQISTG